jgi:response regulator of citrate/malate metabolism
MNRIHILCIEDEPEVLDAIVEGISSLEELFPIETARTAAEARQVLEEIRQERAEVGLVLCDHVLPDQNGVDLLVERRDDPLLAPARKVLITGQAGLEATVEAINRGGLNYYIAKPWNQGELLDVARQQLTDYVIARRLDPLPFMRLLDAGRLAEQIRLRQRTTDR